MGPKDWSFSFRISPLNEYSRLISFRIDCLISLLSKGLKSLLQHHSLKASIFGAQPFFGPMSYLYMTIGKTIALTIQTFVSKMMSLLVNTLSIFVVAFLLRSKHPLLKYKFVYFNWRLITLQYCIGFAIHQHETQMYSTVFWTLWEREKVG